MSQWTCLIHLYDYSLSEKYCIYDSTKSYNNKIIQVLLILNNETIRESSALYMIKKYHTKKRLLECFLMKAIDKSKVRPHHLIYLN